MKTWPTLLLLVTVAGLSLGIRITSKSGAAAAFALVKSLDKISRQSHLHVVFLPVIEQPGNATLGSFLFVSFVVRDSPSITLVDDKQSRLREADEHHLLQGVGRAEEM